MDGLCIDSIRLHNNLEWTILNSKQRRMDFIQIIRLHNNFEWTILDSKQQQMDSIETLQGCNNLNGLCWILSNNKWTYTILYKV
jgi:hypothetical protein